MSVNMNVIRAAIGPDRRSSTSCVSRSARPRFDCAPSRRNSSTAARSSRSASSSSWTPRGARERSRGSPSDLVGRTDLAPSPGCRSGARAPRPRCHHRRAGPARVPPRGRPPGPAMGTRRRSCRARRPRRVPRDRRPPPTRPRHAPAGVERAPTGRPSSPRARRRASWRHPSGSPGRGGSSAIAGCGVRPLACASRSAASAPAKSPLRRRMSPMAYQPSACGGTAL